jgi:hypothetical protein
MTGSGRNNVLAQALALARRGWPVFPCHPGQKVPATRHGHLDATTDEQQITCWFTSQPARNLAIAIATGTPGPDVLDIDQHGPAGNGFAAFRRLRQAGLLDGAAAYVRTPSGGLHAYFTGTRQRSTHRPGQHIDFRAAGGYVLAPPSQIGGTPYQPLHATGRTGTLDWAHATTLLDANRARQHQEPCRQPAPARRPQHQQPAVGTADIGRLAAWVARLDRGNRNAGLFWAANRALDTDHAADLSPPAAAARQAGLGDQEIRATLASARRTTTLRPQPPDHQAEEMN